MHEGDIAGVIGRVNLAVALGFGNWVILIGFVKT